MMAQRPLALYVLSMHTRWSVCALFLVALGACGPVKHSTSAGPRYDLVVNGADFDWSWVEGKPIVLRVFQGTTRVGDPEQDTITQGAFQVTFPDTLEAQVTYQVRYYIDRDADGRCNDLDPGYTMNVTGKVGNANLTFPALDPNAAQTLCNWF